MRWLLLFLVGCGRLAFEASPDARLPSCAGHDEDADGFPDACDLCPTSPDPAQLNPDGDGTSDQCDVTNANDTIAFFDPFIADRSDWKYRPAPHSYVNDSLAIDARTTYFFMDRSGTATNDYFLIAGTIVAVASTGAAQITLSFYTAGTPHYYCEIYGGASTSKVALTYTFDNVQYTSDTKQDLPSGVQPGRFMLIANHRGGNLGCVALGGGVVGAIPAGFGAVDRLAIQTQGLDLRIDHYLHIHTN